MLRSSDLSGFNYCPSPISPGGVQVLGEGVPTAPLDPKRDLETIHLVGGVTLQFRKVTDDKGNTRYFAALGTNPHTGRVFYPTPDAPVDWDGNEIDISKLEVTQATIDRLKSVARGGISLSR